MVTNQSHFAHHCIYGHNLDVVIGPICLTIYGHMYPQYVIIIVTIMVTRPNLAPGYYTRALRAHQLCSHYK